MYSVRPLKARLAGEVHGVVAGTRQAGHQLADGSDDLDLTQARRADLEMALDIELDPVRESIRPVDRAIGREDLRGTGAAVFPNRDAQELVVSVLSV
jgi:hypothetical protein